MSCTLRLELTDDEAQELADWLFDEDRSFKGIPRLTPRAGSAADSRSILDKLRRALKDAGVVVP